MIEFPLGEFAMKTGLELADMVVAAGAGFYEGSSLTLNNLNWFYKMVFWDFSASNTHFTKQTK